jgi:DNA integrity scanning protein DisA with diadenylate cyclase activity
MLTPGRALQDDIVLPLINTRTAIVSKNNAPATVVQRFPPLDGSAIANSASIHASNRLLDIDNVDV